MGNKPRQFTATHNLFGTVINFTCANPPSYLEPRESIKHSTMCQHWYWYEYILTLHVNQQIEGDWRTIKRIK